MVGAVGVERVWGGGSAAGWSSPGFKQGDGGVLRRGSEESEKRAVGIGFWGICRARALARRGRRPLQRALHRDGEAAAARALLDSAARVARPGSSSARQQEGEEVVRDAWVPAHGEVMAGKAGKASAAALSVASAARSRAGRGRSG